MRKIITVVFALLAMTIVGSSYLNAQSYCDSYPTSSADSEIDAVSLTGATVSLNNVTTSTCATYSNFTSLPAADLNPGGTYTINVTVGTCAGSYQKGAKVFIDWNHDYDFADAGETVVSTAFVTVTSSYSMTFTVPTNTYIGNTRMRVVCMEASAASSVLACGTYGYGETEDYTVALNSPYACDLGVVALVDPLLNSNDLTATESVTLKIKNYGNAPQSGFSVAYSIDGGTNFITELVSTTVQPLATYNHTFSATANLAAAGNYNMVFTVTSACDTNNVANNTLSSVLNNQISVTTYPFFANFEGATGNTGWASGGTGNSWQWGVPAASLINAAASPTNVWATNLTGNYNNSESSWVESPYFNFSTLSAPVVEFKMWTNIETGYYDGVCLQYTIDGGLTWQHVGVAYGTASLDPNGENWYNSSAISGLNYMNGWNGSNGGYQSYKYKMYDNTGFYTNLANQATVKFRFLFGSNTSTTYNGVAFDDFQIYQAPNNDLGATALPSLSVVCAGSVPVQCIIKNYGALTNNTATLNWQVNGVAQPSVAYTGPLAPNSTDTVLLGNYNFLNGVAYNVKAWTSLPNGLADEIPGNDTVNVYNFQTSLSGSYTIGATGYFPTITAARNALVTYGVCGPVEFVIQSGTYNEQVAFPVIQGTSATNTITFGSAATNADSVIVQFANTSSANYIWRLDNADYIKLENVTLKSIGTSTYGGIVDIRNDADYNSFIRCKVISLANTSSSSWGFYFTSPACDYTMIDGCFVKYGYYGVYNYGSSGGYSTNNTYKNNIFEDYYYYGIYSYYQNNVTIDNNRITQISTATGYNYAINQYYGVKPTVTRNTVIDNNGTYTYAIRVAYAYTTNPNWGIVANNMVALNGITSATYGLYLYYCNNLKVFHNSVLITGGTASSNYATYMYGSTTNGGPYVLRNNSIVNKGGGYAYYMNEAIYTSGFTSQYNNLYKSTSTTPLTRIVAATNIDCATITAWQATYGPNDLVSVDGGYISNTNLHSTSPQMSDAGTPLADVTIDIDGDARSATTPDIGCDEYEFLGNDLSALGMWSLGDLPQQGGANHVVAARIFNLGLISQYNKTITLEITGANTLSLTTVVDTFIAGQEKVIYFPAYSLSNTGWNTLTMICPADQNNANNNVSMHQNSTANVMSYVDTLGMDGSIGVNDVDGHSWWTKFHSNGNYAVSHMKLWIPNISTNAGKTIYGAVLNSAQAVVAMSDPYVIPASALGTWATIPFPNPTILVMNNVDFYLGVIQPASTAATPIGWQEEAPMRPNTYYFSTNQSGSGLTAENMNRRWMMKAQYLEPFPYDLAITQLMAPASACGMGNESVVFQVKNLGFDTIHAFNISYQVVGSSTPVTEAVTGVTIAPFTTYQYTFNTQYNFAAPTQDSTFQVNGWVSLTGDGNASNDAVTGTVLSKFVPGNPIPYDATVVLSNPATVSVSSPYNVIWYDNAAGGQFIAFGDTFYNTPPLFDTTSYWAVATTGAFGDFILGSSATTYNGSVGNPYGQYWTSAHSQFLITAATLTSLGVMPGAINSLALNVQAPAGAPLQAFNIKMGHTALASLDATAASWTAGLQTVYSVPVWTSVTGWNNHVFQTPFVWNGTSNLVIQFCFSNGTSNYTSAAYLYGDNLSTNAAVGYYTDGTFVCDAPTYFYTSVFRPQMKLNATVPGCESDMVEVVAYVIKPPFDAEVSEITSPVSGCGLGSETVTVKLRNAGSDPITTINMSYLVQGSTGAVTEQVTNINLLPDSIMYYSFTTPYNFGVVNADSVFEISAWSSLTGDTILGNDSAFLALESNYVPALPVASNATVVFGSPATLSVTSPDNIIWYDNPAGGQFIAMGDTFYTTPPLFDTTTYYAVATSGAQGDFYIGSNSTTYNGTTNNPFGQYYTSGQSQYLLTAAYLSSLGVMPGQINSLSLSAQAPAGANLDAFTISLGHTTLSALTATAASWTTSGLQTVYSNASYPSAAGWNYFEFSTPFNWNGVDNVVIQFCFSNGTSNWTTNGTLNGVNMTTPQAVGYYTDGTFTCSAPSYYYTTTFLPYMILNATVPGCETEMVPVTAYVTNIPNADAGISSAVSPQSGVELTFEPIIVVIENMGATAISGFPITVEIDNGTNITEIVSQTIPSGGTITYQFATAAILTAFQTYNICIYTQLPGDLYGANDTLCYTITNQPLIYCTSTATSTGYEEVVNFGLGTFANYSGPAYGAMYTNFTTLGAIQTVYQGLTYPVTVTTDFPPGYTYAYSCYVKLFIDWNHNGTYEAATETAWESPTTSSTTVSGTVTVPITAMPGTHGARLVFVETSSASYVTPCGTYTWGETEDYVITVGTPDPWDAGVTAITSPSGVLTEGDQAAVTVTVYNLGLNAITSMDVSYTLNGGSPVTIPYTGNLASLTSTTVTFPSFTVPGGYYDICSYTTLTNDSNAINDTTCIALYALPQYDLTMLSLVAPENGCDYSYEDVTVQFENLGDTITDGITLGYFTNALTTPVTELYTDTIFPGDVINYTFSTPVNLQVTVDTDFDFTAFVSYGPDPVAINDTVETVVGSYLSPAAPMANGATIWSSEIANLSILNADTTMFYSWFASADTSLITQGITFTTPQLFDTTTYFISSAAGGGSGALSTTYVGGNGQSGNMFNVTALGGNITLESFDVSFSGTTTIDIYYKVGSYVGSETNAAAWTLMGSVANVTGGGTGIGTPVAIGGITIPYGQTYGIWVTTNNSSIVYTTLSAMQTYTDGNLSIYSGIGVSLPLGSIFSPRGWNGTIHYSSGNGCSSTLVPVTVNVQYADFDGGVVAITSPNTGPYLTSAPVTAIIYNNGLNAISGFQASYTVNGGNLVSETVTDTIQPGDSLTFTFTTVAPLSIIGQYNICVSVAVPNDGYALNNQMCKLVTNMDGDGLTCSTAFPYGAVNDPSVSSAVTFAFDVEWWEFDVLYPMENVTISLCGAGTNFDSQLALYDSCSAFSYTYYNDDFCGAYSQITIPGYLQPGTYKVKVYGWSSAFGTFNLNITGTTVSKFLVNLTGTNVSCFGDANGAITSALAAGPTGTTAALPVSYSWAPNSQTTANISGLIAGTYTVTVTDATGWQEEAQITVSQPADITITGVAVDNTAIGGNIGSVDITVTGGTAPYTYHWGNNATTEDVSALYAGIYNVTVIDANGCDQVATFPVNSPSPWTVYPTSIQHLIVIPQNALITLDAIALPAGSFVGVFYDSAGTEKCGGWAYWSGMATTLTAYGQTAGQDNGFAPNELFKWRVYKATTGENYGGDATYNIPMYPNSSSFQIGGLSGIYKVEAFSIIIQNITLPEGWSIWSTYINPTVPNIASVMAAIAVPFTATPTVIVKNGAGQIFWPQYNLNLIGNIVIGQGYQVKISNNNQGTSFGVVGLKLSPSTPFTIPAGWSLIAYLKDYQATATSQLASIAPVLTPTGCTEIVKNGAGQIFWPLYNLCTFPSCMMVPGQGYQIKNKCASITFSYPGTKSEDYGYYETGTPKHFGKAINTGNNMTLGIPQDAWNVEPMYGDEIGVFNANGELVGSSVYEGGFTAVTIWGKEVINPEEKGSDGSIYSIRFWQNSTQSEMDVVVSSWEEGSDSYANNGIAVVSKISVLGSFNDNFVLGQNMPNPFNATTIIPFYAPVDCHINLGIYNALGEKVMDVFNQYVSAGKYEVTFDAADLPAGNYFYKLVSDKFVDVKSLTKN